LSKEDIVWLEINGNVLIEGEDVPMSQIFEDPEVELSFDDYFKESMS